MRFRRLIKTITFILALQANTEAQSHRTFEVSGYPGLDELGPHDNQINVANPLVSRIRLPTGVTLEFTETGDMNGPTVIFLHGFTDSRHSFDYLLPNLDTRIHSLVITQRGHGESDKPAAGYLPGNFAEDLNAFMEAKNINRAVIAGHSMGSAVAQTFVLKYPSKVSGLILMGTIPHLKSNPGLKEFGTQVALLKDPIDHAFASDFQKSTISLPIPETYLDTVINETLKVPSSVWKAVLNGLMLTDLSGNWKNIKTPVLIMYGDKDNFSTLQDQQHLKTSITGARLIVYKGVGHALHWEKPATAANDISSFIKQLTP